MASAPRGSSTPRVSKRGQLRLSQMFKIKRLGFVLKIWELVSSDYYKDEAAWLLVHDVKMTNKGEDKRKVCGRFPSGKW
ncbi:hypothetical protein PanWU01x14_326790 [Parasponia andersonii]|uniref:Uncharacterized protein n=1 Tax=Parasponia andersonii TaxID=3476 RepID=A0A2P5AJ78_PARAD|nr:hypothetical protein PanWU01x14_326790 [Parasponia andersonii]